MWKSRKGKSNLQRQEANQWLPKAEGGKEWTEMGHKGTFLGMMKMFYILIAVVTHVYICQNLIDVHLKWLCFIICELCIKGNGFLHKQYMHLLLSGSFPWLYNTMNSFS